MDKQITKNDLEAYQKETLIACKNGKPCSYGICDECPNIVKDENDRNEVYE